VFLRTVRILRRPHPRDYSNTPGLPDDTCSFVLQDDNQPSDGLFHHKPIDLEKLFTPASDSGEATPSRNSKYPEIAVVGGGGGDKSHGQLINTVVVNINGDHLRKAGLRLLCSHNHKDYTLLAARYKACMVAYALGPQILVTLEMWVFLPHLFVVSCKSKCLPMDWFLVQLSCLFWDHDLEDVCPTARVIIINRLRRGH
jgi:hypothetical protein